MVSTATIVAINASHPTVYTVHSSSSASARRAADEACRTYMAGFDASTATQSQQVQYARCVERFEPMSDGDVMAGKAFVILMLICVIGGIVYGAAFMSPGYSGRFLNGYLCGLTGVVVGMGVGLVAAAISYVLS